MWMLIGLGAVGIAGLVWYLSTQGGELSDTDPASLQAALDGWSTLETPTDPQTGNSVTDVANVVTAPRAANGVEIQRNLNACIDILNEAYMMFQSSSTPVFVPLAETGCISVATGFMYTVVARVMYAVGGNAYTNTYPRQCAPSTVFGVGVETRMRPCVASWLNALQRINNDDESMERVGEIVNTSFADVTEAMDQIAASTGGSGTNPFASMVANVVGGRGALHQGTYTAVSNSARVRPTGLSSSNAVYFARNSAAPLSSNYINVLAATDSARYYVELHAFVSTGENQGTAAARLAAIVSGIRTRNSVIAIKGVNWGDTADFAATAGQASNSQRVNILIKPV
jgi:hypothetical protein